MVYLKQSTAVTKLVGPFLDVDDGDTEMTALAITQAEVRLSKNGGNMAQKGEATSLVHDELGFYTCLLNTDDTDTLGSLKLMIHEATALSVWQEFMVITANQYDTLFSTDLFQTDLTQISGDATSLADLKDFVDTGYDPVAHDVETVKVATASTDVTNRVTANVDQLDSVAQSLTDLKDFADTGYDPILHDVETVKVNTDMVGTDSAALASELLKVPKSDSNVVWNATAQATIKTQVDTSLDAAQTELASAPAYTGSVRNMIQWAFTVLKGVTATTDTSISVKKADGVTELASSTISDDGTTFDRGEFS